MVVVVVVVVVVVERRVPCLWHMCGGGAEGSGGQTCSSHQLPLVTSAPPAPALHPPLLDASDQRNIRAGAGETTKAQENQQLIGNCASIDTKHPHS